MTITILKMLLFWAVKCRSLKSAKIYISKLRILKNGEMESNENCHWCICNWKKHSCCFYIPLASTYHLLLLGVCKILLTWFLAFCRAVCSQDLSPLVWCVAVIDPLLRSCYILYTVVTLVYDTPIKDFYIIMVTLLLFSSCLLSIVAAVTK